MLRIIYLIFLVWIINVVTMYAQKHDYVWCLGYESSGDSTSGFGGQNIYFQSGGPVVNYRERQLDFSASSTSICDKEGVLLFYSNGCKIFTADDRLMEGGDSLTRMDNYWTQEFFCPLGFNFTQGLLTIPNPGDDDIYYLFHQDIKVADDLYPYTDELYVTTVSYENHPKGKVVQKRLLILEEKLHFGTMTATRHGNGHDWWVVMSSLGGNTYHKFLITDIGVSYQGFQNIGNEMYEEIGNPSAKFSPDGRLYARFHISYGLEIMDFNRNTGVFSVPRFTPFWIDPIGSSLGNGLEFSPNASKLYVCYGNELVQFDLGKLDVFGSRTLVSTFVIDTTLEPLQSQFYQMQLGPDDKIYMSHLNGTQSLHTIHDPNALGIDCNFEMRSVRLKTWNAFTMPYFPNFRLGKDTSPSIDYNDRSNIICYPNPTTGILQIEANIVLDKILVYDHIGILVRSFAPSNQIDMQDLAAGLYLITLKNIKGDITTHKVIKID
jgi:Secretion system C-terminal sorting domain